MPMIQGLRMKPDKETVLLYNGDVQLDFSDSSHRYTIFHKGQKLFGTCGVTTIIGVLDKPQLVQWSANMTNDAWIDGLSNAKKIDEVLLHKLSKEAPLAWRMKRDAAGGIGTLIHDWIEGYIKWKLKLGEKPIPPENDILRASVTKFLLWERAEGVTFTATEKKIYSLKHNIAGTCDFLYVTKDGKLGIGDIKSSKGIYDSFSLQVAAYRYMLEEEVRYTTGATPISYEEMTIVRVGKDDGELEVKKIGDYHKYVKAFLACSVLYRTMKSGKKDY